MNEILMIGSRHGFSFCFCVDSIFQRLSNLSAFEPVERGASVRYDPYKLTNYEFFYRW